MTVRERTTAKSPRLTRENLQANYGIGADEHRPHDAQGAHAPAEPSLIQRAIPKLGGGKRLQSFAMWARQTFVLIKSGTPLAQSLLAVEQQAGTGPWRDVLKDVRTQMDEGVALSEAMERHPLYFSAVARSMVAAGESSGELHTMLERLAHLSRQQLRVRRSLLGSMVYPCLLIVVAFVVVGAMIGFVLPRFEGLFDTLDAPLPPTTKLLMQASEIFRANGGRFFWPRSVWSSQRGSSRSPMSASAAGRLDRSHSHAGSDRPQLRDGAASRGSSARSSRARCPCSTRSSSRLVRRTTRCTPG